MKALQERVGITFLYVTHDQEEALTMSPPWSAVMNAYRIAQIGTPRDVYEEPADAYVADFLGARQPDGGFGVLGLLSRHGQDRRLGADRHARLAAPTRPRTR